VWPKSAWARRAHELNVSVKADKDSYAVRGKAQVTVTVKLPNGQPAANAEVAVAAVDQALLELHAQPQLEPARCHVAAPQPGAWKHPPRKWKSSAGSHYGRKAVPPGGGGGHSGAREAAGDAAALEAGASSWTPMAKRQVTVPLNDALTTFKIVAGGRCLHRLVRHRQHQHPRHARSADHQRPAAPGA